jgi:hypothetical protein
VVADRQVSHPDSRARWVVCSETSPDTKQSTPVAMACSK